MFTIALDFESTYNLLIALIKDATSDVFPTLVHNIITPIVESGPEKGALKLKVYVFLYIYIFSISHFLSFFLFFPF